MLLRAQRERIQIKVIGRLAVCLEDLAVYDELDMRDFGLAAGIHQDDFGIDDFIIGGPFKVVGDGGRQSGDLEFGAQLANIAFDIFHGDIQLVFARLLLRGLNGVTLFRRNNFAVDGVFDALNILVGLNLHRDLRVFGQGIFEDILWQGEQRNRYGRAQGGRAGSPASISRNYDQRKIVSLAVRGHVYAQGHDILAAE